MNQSFKMLASKTETTIFVHARSQDCQQWSQLPVADRSLREKCARLQGRFTGRPEHVHEQKVVDKVGDGDSVQEQTTTVSPPAECQPLVLDIDSS